MLTQPQTPLTAVYIASHSIDGQGKGAAQGNANLSCLSPSLSALYPLLGVADRARGVFMEISQGSPQARCASSSRWGGGMGGWEAVSGLRARVKTAGQ